MVRNIYSKNELENLVARLVELIWEIPMFSVFQSNPFFLDEVMECFIFLDGMESEINNDQIDNEKYLFSCLSGVAKTLLAAIGKCKSHDRKMEEVLDEVRSVLKHLKEYQVLKFNEESAA